MILSIVIRKQKCENFFEVLLLKKLKIMLWSLKIR